MRTLVRTEWLKMKKYPAFWWMLLIVALSYPGINYMLYTSGYKDQLSDPNMGPILQLLPNPFTFPGVWQTVAFTSSLFIFIPALMVIMFMTNEFTFKTHRQNIIDGWSRNQFLLAKMIDVLIVTIVVTLLYTLTVIIIGSINAGKETTAIWKGAQYMGAFFLLVFSQLSLALLIALLVRRAFMTMGIFMFYYFPLEPYLVVKTRKYAPLMSEFFPLEISDRLIPYPRWFIRNENEWKTVVQQSNSHIVYTLLLIVLTWALCLWINKKRDL